MLPAIQLDHKKGFAAVKVCDVFANGLLAVYFYGVAPEEVVPEVTLLPGHLLAEGSGIGDVFAFVGVVINS